MATTAGTVAARWRKGVKLAHGNGRWDGDGGDAHLAAVNRMYEEASSRWMLHPDELKTLGHPVGRTIEVLDYCDGSTIILLGMMATRPRGCAVLRGTEAKAIGAAMRANLMEAAGFGG